MLLFHGTSGKWIPNILRQGLEPRGRKVMRSNWRETVPSNPNCVYLSDCYAPHFAFNAAGDGDKAVCAVIEIETDRLPVQSLLLPDEDCLEQAGRGHDGVPGDMRARTLHYRRQMLRRFSGTDAWKLSLEYLGTCAYHGIVPPGAITRIVTWPHQPNIKLMLVWDLSVSLINQQVCGNRYRVLTRKLFDGEFDEPITARPQHWLDNPPLPPIEGWQIQHR
jgi:hypothetical protein